MLVNLLLLKSFLTINFVKVEEDASLRPFLQVREDRPPRQVMQNNDVVLSEHGGDDPRHYGLVVRYKLLLLLLLALLIDLGHVWDLHGLQHHGVLELYQDLLENCDVLVGVLAERDIQESERVDPLLRLLVDQLKLNQHEVVLEVRVNLHDLLLDVFELSRVPGLLDNCFLYQKTVLFLLP